MSSSTKPIPMSDKPKRRYRKLNTPEMMASIDRMIAQGQRALHIAQHLHIDSKMVAGRAQRKGYYLAYVKADEHKAILQQRAAKLPTPPL